jgi:hypothetical protein
LDDAVRGRGIDFAEPGDVGKNYLDALQAADRGDFTPLLKFAMGEIDS